MKCQCEPPDDPIWFQKMKDSGVDSLGMHLEVVEEEIRKKILPGKSEISLKDIINPLKKASQYLEEEKFLHIY